MTVPEDALQIPHRDLAWRSPGDTLEMMVSGGYAGTSILLTAESGRWVGSGTTWDDYSGMRWGREIRLEAVDCTTVLSVPATADRPLVRSIRLDDGAVVTLGQPLPPGTPAAVARYGLQVLRDAAHPWAGTDFILVTVGPEADSIVTRIETRFPARRNLDIIQDSLELVNGPGLRSVGAGRIWLNRTTRVYLHQYADWWRLVFEDPRWH